MPLNLGIICSIVIDKLRGKIIVTFIRKYETIFWGDLTIVHPDQQCMRVPDASSFLTLDTYHHVFQILAFHVGVELFLTVVLICIFLMTPHLLFIRNITIRLRKQPYLRPLTLRAYAAISNLFWK